MRVDSDKLNLIFWTVFLPIFHVILQKSKNLVILSRKRTLNTEHWTSMLYSCGTGDRNVWCSSISYGDFWPIKHFWLLKRMVKKEIFSSPLEKILGAPLDTRMLCHQEFKFQSHNEYPVLEHHCAHGLLRRLRACNNGVFGITGVKDGNVAHTTALAGFHHLRAFSEEFTCLFDLSSHSHSLPLRDTPSSVYLNTCRRSSGIVRKRTELNCAAR